MFMIYGAERLILRGIKLEAKDGKYGHEQIPTKHVGRSK